MGLEPHVDAIDMEPVIAFRQQPSLLPNLELAQADSTIEALLKLVRPEDHDRQGLQDGGLEPSALFSRGGFLAWGEVEEAAPLVLDRAPLHVPREPLGVKVEEQGKDDNQEEEYDESHRYLSRQLHCCVVVQSSIARVFHGGS